MSSLIDLGFGDASLVYNGKIIHFKFKDDPTIDLKSAKMIEDAVLKLSEGNPIIMFVDIRGVIGEFNADAKMYLLKSQDLKKVRKGQVFVIDSLSNRIIASFYSRLFRRKISSKIFNNYDAALKWAKEQADQLID